MTSTIDEFQKILDQFQPRERKVKTPFGGKPLDLYFTSEAEIRAKVYEALGRAQPPTEEEVAASGIRRDAVFEPSESAKKTREQMEKIAQDWIQLRIAEARRSGLLLSEQQHSDWTLGVKLQPGMKVRYIGPTRTELTASGKLVERLQGSTGLVSGIETDKHGRTIVVAPDEPGRVLDADGEPTGENMLVDLAVLEYSRGWLNVERIPE